MNRRALWIAFLLLSASAAHANLSNYGYAASSEANRYYKFTNFAEIGVNGPPTNPADPAHTKALAQASNLGLALVVNIRGWSLTDLPERPALTFKSGAQVVRTPSARSIFHCDHIVGEQIDTPARRGAWYSTC
jgi:hypothetical protein